MRKIIITRKKNFWCCSLIWQVKLDNNIVGTLRNGETINITADSETPHIIQCVCEKPGELGGSTTIISDIVNIPNDLKNYTLLGTSKLASIKLEIIKSD